MAGGNRNEVYYQIVEVTQDYLGPAAHRFIDRSIASHLKKEPNEITSKDVTKLVEWVKISVAFLTEDTALVSEYVSRLRSVASDHTKGKE